MAAKKREWKAWMVVFEDDGIAVFTHDGAPAIYQTKKKAKEDAECVLDRKTRIIRVRIVEEK